jgi:hypothetical protein
MRYSPGRTHLRVTVRAHAASVYQTLPIPRHGAGGARLGKHWSGGPFVPLRIEDQDVAGRSARWTAEAAHQEEPFTVRGERRMIDRLGQRGAICPGPCDWIEDGDRGGRRAVPVQAARQPESIVKHCCRHLEPSEWRVILPAPALGRGVAEGEW